MSKTVRLAVALALTAVTATGALAAQYGGAHPRVFSGDAVAPEARYGAPPSGWNSAFLGGKLFAAAPQADATTIAPKARNGTPPSGGDTAFLGAKVLAAKMFAAGPQADAPANGDGHQILALKRLPL
jgi:hypothetical protein